MKIRVRLTKSHIKNGQQGKWTGCPIFLSLANKKNFIKPRVVYLDYVQFGDENYTMVKLPDSAIKFIRTFDISGPLFVRPFSFTMEIPNELCRQ